MCSPLYLTCLLSGEQVEIDLDDIALEGNNVALSVLLQINAKAPSWLRIAQEHLQQNRLPMAQETLRVAVQGTLLVPTVMHLQNLNFVQSSRRDKT